MTLPPSLKTLTEETRRGIFVRFASQTKRTRRGNVLLRRNPEYRFRKDDTYVMDERPRPERKLDEGEKRRVLGRRFWLL